MSRTVIVVLDGFGIGAMPDAGSLRPGDITADTCAHVLDGCRELTGRSLRLPVLRRRCRRSRNRSSRAASKRTSRRPQMPDRRISTRASNRPCHRAQVPHRICDPSRRFPSCSTSEAFAGPTCRNARPSNTSPSQPPLTVATPSTADSSHRRSPRRIARASAAPARLSVLMMLAMDDISYRKCLNRFPAPMRQGCITYRTVPESSYTPRRNHRLLAFGHVSPCDVDH